MGIDISSQAVGYVRENLKIPCFEGDFEQNVESFFSSESFNVLTMWFVIEHFRNPDKVLYWANRLLKTGGIFAFSTPNGAGISALKDMREFLKNSPPDHCTIWRPARVRRILRRFGFRLRIMKTTGHHPERCPRFVSNRQKPMKGRYPILRAASKMFGLGDTFEVYAEKIRRL